MKKIILIIGIFLIAASCQKSAYLNENPDQSLIIPSEIADYQAILDNYASVNYVVPELSESAADNYYWLEGYFESVSQEERNVYIWDDDIWHTSINNNYTHPYNVIYNCNTVIEGLKKIEENQQSSNSFKNTMGSALFLRAVYYYQLSQLFIPVYDENTLDENLGIPLRLTPDINEKITRSSIRETYDQIIVDLKEAVSLLPNLPQIVTRPSKVAAIGLLARTYLMMNKYDSSLSYAEKALEIKSELMDFNTIEKITEYNVEVLWPGIMLYSNVPIYDYTITAIDSGLIKSYNTNDLRGELFYTDNALGGKFFSGSYSGILGLFAGIATDEMYLISAESYARLDMNDKALKRLNDLLEKRWKNNGTWAPINSSNSGQTLNIILEERRKELVLRGLRWSDLRRLNKEGRNIELKRKLDDGTIITLSPNSLKYTFLIPPAVISFNPGMPQNAR